MISATTFVLGSPELIIVILSQLGFQDLIKVQRVCRLFRDVVMHCGTTVFQQALFLKPPEISKYLVWRQVDAEFAIQSVINSGQTSHILKREIRGRKIVSLNPLFAESEWIELGYKRSTDFIFSSRRTLARLGSNRYYLDMFITEPPVTAITIAFQGVQRTMCQQRMSLRDKSLRYEYWIKNKSLRGKGLSKIVREDGVRMRDIFPILKSMVNNYTKHLSMDDALGHVVVHGAVSAQSHLVRGIEDVPKI